MQLVTVTSGNYRFGSDTGTLHVRTGREGFAASAGHDLLIEVTRWSGTAHVDRDAPERSSVLASLDVGSFEVRAGTGGVKPLTDDDRAEIKATLERKVLDRARHPAITFVTRAVTTSSDTLRLDGGLTIRGVLRPIIVDVHLVDVAMLHFTGTASVIQTRWNITPYKRLFGGLKVADAVTVHLDLTLLPA
jgi:polyisoprenoid-binding protein YceI